jgi:hypothetical protein
MELVFPIVQKDIGKTTKPDQKNVALVTLTVRPVSDQKTTNVDFVRMTINSTKEVVKTTAQMVITLTRKDVPILTNSVALNVTLLVLNVTDLPTPNVPNVKNHSTYLEPNVSKTAQMVPSKTTTPRENVLNVTNLVKLALEKKTLNVNPVKLKSLC